MPRQEGHRKPHLFVYHPRRGSDTAPRVTLFLHTVGMDRAMELWYCPGPLQCHPEHSDEGRARPAAPASFSKTGPLWDPVLLLLPPGLAPAAGPSPAQFKAWLFLCPAPWPAALPGSSKVAEKPSSFLRPTPWPGSVPALLGTVPSSGCRNTGSH